VKLPGLSSIRGGAAPVGGDEIPPGFSFCAGEIGVAITGSVIDPSRLGIAMNLLKDGFRLNTVNLSAQADCGPDGSAAYAIPHLETGWTADPGGQQIFVSQSLQAQSQGNVLDNGFASFWWQGYLYTLQLGWTPVPLLLGPGGERPPFDDPFSQLLIRAAQELAPGLSIDCFSRRVSGGWEDLALLAIGDPRAAIPPEFSQTGFDLQYLTKPAAGCPVGPPPEESAVTFWASFSNPQGGNIGLSAWSLPAAPAPSPGSLDDYSLNWSSDRYAFSIYGDSGGAPLGRSALLSIARRLDPGFSPDCLLQTVSLADASLPELGFHAPQPPAGYALLSESLSGAVVSASCTRPFDFRGRYDLSWSFASPQDLALTASASRLVSDHPGPRTAPVVTDSCVSWSDEKGTSYVVTGFSASGAPGPGTEVLLAVARSMDPGLVIPN
jgi:hypothetical protein